MKKTAADFEEKCEETNAEMHQRVENMSGKEVQRETQMEPRGAQGRPKEAIGSNSGVNFGKNEEK